MLGFGCSSLVSWGNSIKDSGIYISRHLDWNKSETLGDKHLVLVHEPADKSEQKWVMIGFPGQIAALSGVNESKLSVFQHMLYDGVKNAYDGKKKYVPIWFSLRKSLESKDLNDDNRCNTLDVRKALEENNNYSNSYIAVAASPDTKADKAIVIEIAPKYPSLSVRNVDFQDNIHGNHLFAANSAIVRKRRRKYCKRYFAVSKELKRNSCISAEQQWKIMKTYSILNSNLQFMQYISSTNTLKLSVFQGVEPAYLRKPFILNLTKLFGAEINDYAR